MQRKVSRLYKDLLYVMGLSNSSLWCVIMENMVRHRENNYHA